MTFEGLECFATIARGSTFQDAAETYNLSQSALSKIIQKMEDELGVKLFDRTGRSAKLTKAGERLLQDYSAMEPYYRTLVTHMRQLSQKRQINVVLGLPGGVLHIRNILDLFKVEHPEIPLNVVIREKDKLRFAEEAIHSPDMDLIIMHKLRHYEGVRYLTLLEDDPMRVVLPKDHPLRGKEKVFLEDLTEERIRVSKWGHELLKELSRQRQIWFSNAEVVMERRGDTIWNVASGQGIAIFHESDLYGLPLKRVVVKPLADVPKIPIIMIYNSNVMMTPSHTVLKDFLLEAVREELSSL
ncbi:MAG: LysR family transcriptional regulator [Faecousia sp.]